MSKALYRQYRSQSLEEVIGQEHITDLLTEAIVRKSFSHAYLFTGPRGVGKTSVARIMAHEINELPYTDNVHLDIIEIDAASNRRIDDIRDLREKVHIAPSSAKYKVYIIDEVHMLTGESFNALLKTLEEPPSHVIFILATTELHKVPATIASRTQRFAFRSVARDKVTSHLRMIADKEKIKIDNDALRLIAEHGEGSFRDSISLLDQLSSIKKGSNDAISVADIEHVLGLAPQAQLDAIVSAVIKKDVDSAVAVLRRLYEDGHAPASIVSQLMLIVPDAAAQHPALYELLHDLLDVPRSFSPQIKLLTAIARAAQRNKPARAAAHAVVSEPVITATVKEMRQQTKTPVKADLTSEPEVINIVDSVTTSAEPIVVNKDAEGFNWPLVMEMLQKRNTALHSVLKRAEMAYDNNVLTLAFAYNLHRKKLEDTKYRSQLVALIADVCGVAPELNITLRGEKGPSNPVAASVADIMGGGVEVNA